MAARKTKGRGRAGSSRARSKGSGRRARKTAARADREPEAPEPDSATAEPSEDAQPAARSSAFPVVGIGGSAGSLAALQDLLLHLPADSGIALVVVSHGDPRGPSLLPEILEKCTRMPVHHAADGMRVKPGHVYVAPPGRHLGIHDGKLKLEEAVERGHVPLPIDSFLRSLANDQRHRAVGIVLSGSGADGTLGLGAIREQAGLTLVQNPQTAEFSGMPASALAAGVADLVLAVNDMPERLLAHARSLATHGRAVSSAPVQADALERIVMLVGHQTGHDFSAYKQGTLQRRIERRMHLHHVERLADYVQQLEQSPEEVEALWRDWLIGVSRFFREPGAFEALASSVLPTIVAGKQDGASLRIWVPGCSTGEEAYSLTMIALEKLLEMGRRLDVQVFATDLDARAIEVARTGRYPEGIAADVGEERLRRFFSPDDRHYRVKKEVRDRIVFATQNVLRDPPFTRMDLISCRNLLIYLTPAAQRRLIRLLHYSLSAGGILFLGASESVTGFEQLFAAVDKHSKLFRRKEAPTAVRIPRDWASRHEAVGIPAGVGTGPGPTPGAGPDLSDVLRKQLAERYAPPSVVVDERGQIEQIHGRTGLFLEPAPGRAALNVLEMAREGLRAPLTSALRRVSRGEVDVAEKTARVKTNGDLVDMRVVLRRLSEPRLPRPLFLVSFEPATEPPPSAPPPKKGGKRRPARAEPAPAARVEQLEAELRATREDLQSTIEELQAANEELASANEEVQSVNEELQSTNEELQTSKEETQSLNEELRTVNAELSAKVEGLEWANDDLLNLMNSTEIAIVFLDEELSVKRFTAEARRLFRLIETDVGRPLADLSTTLVDIDLRGVAQRVLHTLVPYDAEVRAQDGSWFVMRIRPYRTSRNAIAGLVLTFGDVTRLERAERDAKAARVLARNIVDTVREPLVVLDGQLRVVNANRSYYRTFRLQPDETVGRPLRDLGDRQWDIPELQALLQRSLREDESFDDFRVERDFPRIGRRVMLLNGRRMPVEEDEIQVLLAIEDVTDRRAETPPARTSGPAGGPAS